MPFERVLASLRIDGEQAKERTQARGPLLGPPLQTAIHR